MKPNSIQHLYLRAGFGLNPKEFILLRGKSKKSIVNNLFSNSNLISKIEVSTIENILPYKDFKKLNTEQKKQLRKINNQKLIELNIAWLHKIMNSKEVLRERMTLFWANHFVCKGQNCYHIQQFNNLLRENALGNFKDFVKKIAKSASMLKYLNAKQNKKNSPNENFARELMELFTLGIGNYSEKDIKESAKAFTGWSSKFDGTFIIRKKQHDYSEKVFLNKKGNFTGDDIIDIILNQKQCARFICTKIYSYFVNTTINQQHIDKMVAEFYPNYNISNLMHFVFMSNWFYNDENINTKIKSPIDLLVGIHKMVPFHFKKNKQLIYLQKRLGQQLLNPPNVAGWKGGQNWIDTNTLMLRLKLPSILLNNAIISLKGISEFEDTYEQYVKNNKTRKNYLKIAVDWDSFEAIFKGLSRLEIEQIMLGFHINENALKLLSEINFTNSKDYCIQLMSMPEYQLC